MVRKYKRYCHICGDRVENDSHYCCKHSDYSKRPNNPTQKYCSWCGSSMEVDNYDDECPSCQDEERRCQREMESLDERYKNLQEKDTPDYFWATCPECALKTIHHRLYGDNGFVSFVTGGLVNINLSPTGYVKCFNCHHRYKE